MSLLHVSDVRKSLGGAEIVRGCSLSVETGQIIGLIGPNGAGKTTLFRMVAGELHPDQGRVEFAGNNITQWQADKIARSGLVKTFQIPALFDGMSVIENLLVAAPRQLGERFWSVWLQRERVLRQEQEREAKSWNVLQSLKLEYLANELADNLSAGQKKLVELGRALMTEPQLMLLDEPIAGVHPNLVRDIFVTIQELRRRGQTFFIIEHKMDFIFEISDMIYVMADGKILTSGTPEAVRNDRRVLDAYLGIV